MLHRHCVTTVSYETVGPLINRSVMEDAAWRATVGMKPPTERRRNTMKPPEPTALKHEERLAISVIAGSTFTHDGEIHTGDLVTVLSKFLDKKRDAVMRILRDLEAAGFISQVQSEDRGTVLHWQLRDLSVRRKLDQLVDLLLIVDQVIAIQRADPENPEAGKDLLPEGIYYNILAQRNMRRAQLEKS